MNWSCCLLGCMLSTNFYCPLYTCSATSRISWSEEPKRVLTKGCFRTISLAMAVCWRWRHLCMWHCCSLLYIAAALWNKCSNTESPHSWCWIIFQPDCSLLICSRNCWPPIAHSATLFKCPVIRAVTLTHLLKAAKVLYCRVTIYSILQWCVVSVMIIVAQS